MSIKPSYLNSSFVYGGDEENRTPDPLLARQVLSQLSYTPKFGLILCINAFNLLQFDFSLRLPCALCTQLSKKIQNEQIWWA